MNRSQDRFRALRQAFFNCPSPIIGHERCVRTRDCPVLGTCRFRRHCRIPPSQHLANDRRMHVGAVVYTGILLGVFTEFESLAVDELWPFVAVGLFGCASYLTFSKALNLCRFTIFFYF